MRFNRNGYTDGVGIAVVLAGTFAVGATITGAVGKVADIRYGEEEAQEYLEQNNYSDVTYRDTDLFLVGVRGCGTEDYVKYEFDATAPNGAEVGAIVCKGIFKGATFRQD